MFNFFYISVANIANNLNNNNNNQNDNNLNYVHQQNNNLNMNQNIVNQLNIDLPPPVPGKRAVSDVSSLHEKVILTSLDFKYVKPCIDLVQL